VVVLQVPADRVGAGVESLGGELPAQSNDQINDVSWGGVRSGMGPSGSWFERGVAFVAVTGKELVDP